MIIDTILKVLTLPVLLLIDGLQAFSFTIPVGVFNGLSLLAKDLGYIFPVASLMPIIIMKLAFRVFSLFWTVVLKIKSFIPTMGD